MLAQPEINQENVEFLTENTSKARGDVNFPTPAFDGNRYWQDKVRNTVSNEVSTLTQKVITTN